MEDADEALRAMLQRIDYELGVTGGGTLVAQATFGFDVKEVQIVRELTDAVPLSQL